MIKCLLTNLRLLAAVWLASFLQKDIHFLQNEYNRKSNFVIGYFSFYLNRESVRVMKNTHESAFTQKPIKVVILTGAGMSADSGIKTFRDADGLWEGHDVMEVASPAGWQNNPELVLNFYNQRRKQLFDVNPNAGHMALAEAEKTFDVAIVTQNVDDLHERAGSSNVLHLHGELRKVQSTQYPEIVYDWLDDLCLGDQCERGAQLRPFIVWFGEQVPMLELAVAEVASADIVIVVGTSLKVYPAAGLTSFAPENTPIYYVDANPNVDEACELMPNVKVIAQSASEGLPMLLSELMEQFTVC